MNPGDETPEGAAAIRTVLGDADPLARRMLRHTLARSRMTVVAEATTGREARELATFYRPDLAVMDAQMPELAGTQTARQNHARSRAICVILLSSAADERRGLRALRAGASGYPTKELEPAVLPRVLRGALDGEAAI